MISKFTLLALIGASQAIRIQDIVSDLTADDTVGEALAASMGITDESAAQDGDFA